MAARSSRREQLYFYNHLTGLAKTLENMYTTIDLRNEATVTGKIVLVDGFMNIELEDAVLFDARENEIPFETFFIRARNIRYVHIPLEVSIIDSVKKFGNRNPAKENTKKTFKIKRAQLKHQQTLAELASTSKE